MAGSAENQKIVAFTGSNDALHGCATLSFSAGEKILELEKKSRYKTDSEMGGCGIKIYHLDRWQSAEAELVHLRALAFFSQVFECPEPVADVSMANIFRTGDYCMPHSHIRTRASLVYSLACGDPDPGHTRSGNCVLQIRACRYVARMNRNA